MKYLGVIGVFVFAAAFLVISEGADNHWGVAGPQDILLHRQIVSVGWKLFRVITQNVEFYPQNSNRTITAIRAFDFNAGRHGGKAVLKKGGPGFRNATIQLKSPRSHGLYYSVEIIGF